MSPSVVSDWVRGPNTTALGKVALTYSNPDYPEYQIVIRKSTWYQGSVYKNGSLKYGFSSGKSQTLLALKWSVGTFNRKVLGL